MAKHRDYASAQLLKAGFLNAMQDFLQYQAFNIGLTVVSTTVLRVPAGTDDAMAVIAINGQMCYRTTDLNITHPGGNGVFDIYLTCPILDTAAEDAGTWNYDFGYTVVAHSGSPPSLPGYYVRKIGEYLYSSSRITDYRMTLEASGHAYEHRQGGADPLYFEPWQTITGIAGTMFAGQSFRICKGPDSIVRFESVQATCQDATKTAATLTLPVGYRPGPAGITAYFAVPHRTSLGAPGRTGMVSISPSGNVTPLSSPANTPWVNSDTYNFSLIQFRADPSVDPSLPGSGPQTGWSLAGDGYY